MSAQRTETGPDLASSPFSTVRYEDMSNGMTSSRPCTGLSDFTQIRKLLGKSGDAFHSDRSAAQLAVALGGPGVGVCFLAPEWIVPIQMPTARRLTTKLVVHRLSGFRLRCLHPLGFLEAGDGLEACTIPADPQCSHTWFRKASSLGWGLRYTCPARYEIAYMRT
jgi:hypothetical protein